MLLGRTKHSQKYTEPDPEDKQSNAKIRLVWVKHETQITWNWDPNWTPPRFREAGSSTYLHTSLPNCAPEKYLTSAAACPPRPGSQELTGDIKAEHHDPQPGE